MSNLHPREAATAGEITTPEGGAAPEPASGPAPVRAMPPPDPVRHFDTRRLALVIVAAVILSTSLIVILLTVMP